MNLRIQGPDELNAVATLLEEFTHHFQFSATQIGLLFRLICLAQALTMMDILVLLGNSSTARLVAPWLTAKSDIDQVESHLGELRALEVTNQLLLGVKLEGDPFEATEKTKAILARRLPFIELGDFALWSLDEHYDREGLPKLPSSTRSILESHASAYAFRLLELNGSPETHDLIFDYIARKRLGLYRTIEDIAHASGVREIALETVLRLGDMALGGRFFWDVGREPVDVLTQALPYFRYRHGLETMREAGEIPPELAPPSALGEKTLAELATRLHGDAPPIFSEQYSDEHERGRKLAVQQMMKRIVDWVDGRVGTSGLTPFELSTTVEIGRAALQYLSVLMETSPGTPNFAPTPERLRTLCRLCDYPTVSYGSSREVFLCEPVEDADPVLGQAMNKTTVALHTNRLLRGASTGPRSDETGMEGIASYQDFLQSFGVSLDQVT